VALFDVHAHLTHPRLRDDVPEILERARAAGVSTIISNGLNPDDNAEVAALAERESMVQPAFGLYPIDAVLREMTAAGIEYPREPADWDGEDGARWVEEHSESAIAVGEIGLDGHWVPSEFWDRQEELFRRLVRHAIKIDKPVIIHTRKRERRAFEILVEEGAKRVNWHCYGGRVKLAKRIAAETDHRFSIPANARRSESFTAMLRKLPRDRILLETDCPYLGPKPGMRNEPATVAGTLAYIAEVWEETPEAVETRLTENFEDLFRVSP
jgi:TatD DNase family protein